MPSTRPPTPPSTPILSRDVAKRLGVSLPQLYQLVRTGRAPEPLRDSSGRYIWSESDIGVACRGLSTDLRRKEQRARKAVRHGD
jgi:predicted DNA-binding transcriptional regulator AlpA